MYNEYFGFKEAPFSIAPDPRYLYMTAQHRDALAHLVYGLNSEGGCILLTGEVGTGKTTICRCLLEQIPEQAKVALVLNPRLSEIELLETICDELKIAYPDNDNSVKTYTDRIYNFLIESNRNNEKTVLIIDEAQNLSSEVLEQLRLLTNLETNQRKLLQIIILGQPELLDILARKEMRQLAQRITARFHLQPLTKVEVNAYVSHRLAVAGQNVQLFPAKTIKLLYSLSRGIPRLINVICDRSLLGAYVENQHAVHPSIMKKAATEVFGELSNVEKQHEIKSRVTSKWLLPIALVSASALIAVGALYHEDFGKQKNDESAAVDITATGDETDDTIKETANDNAAETKTPEITPLVADYPVEDTPANDLLAIPAGQGIDITDRAQTDIEAADNTHDDADSHEQADTPVEPRPALLTRYDDIEEIVGKLKPGSADAYSQLFNSWNRQYKNTGINACTQAAEYSLSCLHKQGNLNSLKVHNRPAVLKLVNKQGQVYHVTITAIEQDSATIYANKTAYQVKLSQLDQYWYGNFILLWKKPENYRSSISPGDSGEAVNWLYTQFVESDENTAKDRVYGEELVSKVKYFQAKHGLTADGIVGPITIIHLNTDSGLDVPVLTRQS